MTKTTLFSVLCIALRLGAVFLCVHALLTLSTLLPWALWAGDSWRNVAPLSSLAFAVGLFLLGFLLWLYPGPLARMAAGRASHETVGSDIDARDLQYVGLSLLGCWLLISAVLDALYVTRMFWAASRDVRDVMTWSPDIVAQFVMAAVQLVFGFALLLGARGLSELLHRIRHGARSSSEAAGD